MLVIAVVAGVSIKITKAKLDNIISYTYYMGYSTLRNVTGQILSDFKSTDSKYLEVNNSWFNKLFSNPAYSKTYYIPYNPGVINGGIMWEGTSWQGNYNFFDNLDDMLDYCSKYSCSSYKYQENINSGKYKKCSGKYNFYAYSGNYFFSTLRLPGCSISYKGTCYADDAIFLYENIDTYSETECNHPCTNRLDLAPNSANNCGDFAGGHKDTGYYFRIEQPFKNEVTNPLENYSCQRVHAKLVSGTLYTTYPVTSAQYTDEILLYCTPKSGNTYPPYAIEEDDAPEPEPETCTEPSQATKDAQYCQGKEWSSEICNWKDITPWPPCNQEGSRWSQTSCACVPETATLPRKGANFCEKFLDYTNTKSTAEECNGDAIASNLTDFTDKKADIVLRNGLKLYNVRQNPAPLHLLAGNNQGGSYELADGTTVNVNEFGYTVYLDIDGEKGSSTLWEDVFPFYITMAGKVIPLYHTEGEKEYGGTSRQHLMTSVQKEVITTTGHRQVLWIKKSVPFKESACTSGYINSTTPYCSGVSLEPTCNEGANVCILKYVSPVKFF